MEIRDLPFAQRCFLAPGPERSAQPPGSAFRQPHTLLKPTSSVGDISPFMFTILKPLLSTGRYVMSAGAH